MYKIYVICSTNIPDYEYSLLLLLQAMGYLHARGIIHKGLNTKNIFIEKTTDKKDKVVITDMGLSGLSSSIWSR